MSPLSQFLLLAPALMLASTVWAQSAKKSAHSTTAATPSVRAVELANYQIARAPDAPGAPKLLVHLWSAPRRNPAGGGMYGLPPGTYTGKITRGSQRFARFASFAVRL